jgi:microcystin-dependent protein
MAEPFIGQLMMVGFNWAPKDWALCDGQLLPISQHNALFSLLGTTFGGNGRTTFGLPDLRGRVPIHQGHGPGLSDHHMGDKGGYEQVTLIEQQMPQHSHEFNASRNYSNDPFPGGNMFGESGPKIYSEPGNPVAMDPQSISKTGGGQKHINMQPYTCVNFIIALAGTYPSRP